METTTAAFISKAAPVATSDEVSALIWAIFIERSLALLSFFILCVCNCAFATPGHRLPFACFAVFGILSIIKYLLNIFLLDNWWRNNGPRFSLGSSVAMEALSDLTGRGATILLYLGLILVLWERCRALKAAFEGRSHSKLLDTTLPIIHSNILLGLLVLGPTTAAFAALREHSCLPLQIDLTDISQTAVLREDWCGRAAKIFNALSYAFTAFAVLATTATAVHARLVYSHWLYLSDKMTEHMSRRIPMLYISDGIITLAYTICTIQANWFTGAVGAVCFDGAKDILDCYIVYCVVSKGKKLDNWAVWKEEAPVVQREIEPQPPRVDIPYEKSCERARFVFK